MQYELAGIEGSTRIAILSDFHFPFHDPGAVILALQIIEVCKPQVVVLAGDVVDFAGISWFGKPPERGTGFRFEIYAARRLVRILLDHLPPEATVLYLEGNHERRMTSTLMRGSGQALFDLDVLRVDALLQLPHQVKYLAREDVPQPLGKHVPGEIKAGHLYITHGDSFRGVTNMINVARTLYLKLQTSMVIGHWHRNDSYFQTDYEGRPHGFWVSGCLALPRPDYDASRIWGQGMIVADVYWPEGIFQITQVPFIPDNGNVITFWNGVKYAIPRNFERDMPDIREIWRGIGCVKDAYSFETF
jgi:predicted phosphodiesterase